ncbi:hypothetical protein [uncultured Kordia sp.]|uniref:hypothetical protein n=1 Tax=uncultured Kordia sp. TaxID=507699 RepID=UPI00260AC482|nr:hypothetical protein [uncultured Kordia sp.]
MKSHEIKDILEERRIEASENSWEKLAGQLDANDRKGRKKGFYYMYAACLAVLVSMLVFMFAKSVTSIEDGTLVNEDINSKSIIKEEKLQKEQEKVEKEIINNTQIAIEEKAINNTKEEVVERQIVPQPKEQLTVELRKEIQSTIAIQEKEIQPKIETIIAQKEVVADTDSALKESIIALLQKEKMAITNAEIDQLLLEAQQSLNQLDIKEEKVDVLRFATADELLNDVEYELDMSFKQKVFELIKQKVKKRSIVEED